MYKPLKIKFDLKKKSNVGKVIEISWESSYPFGGVLRSKLTRGDKSLTH